MDDTLCEREILILTDTLCEREVLILTDTSCEREVLILADTLCEREVLILAVTLCFIADVTNYLGRDYTVGRIFLLDQYLDGVRNIISDVDASNLGTRLSLARLHCIVETKGKKEKIFSLRVHQ